VNGIDFFLRLFIGLITRIYRKLKNLTLQRINNLLNKWVNELKRPFSSEVQMYLTLRNA
jgi:uncharacterized membrane protein